MAKENINRVVLSGNLTRDPETREAGSTTVTSLRLASNARRKVAGEWTDVAGFYDVDVWGGQGENVARFLEKGRPVLVDGRLEWREWEDKEGNKRQSISITADRVEFVSTPQGASDAPAEDDDEDPGF